MERPEGNPEKAAHARGSSDLVIVGRTDASPGEDVRWPGEERLVVLLVALGRGFAGIDSKSRLRIADISGLLLPPDEPRSTRFSPGGRVGAWPRGVSAGDVSGCGRVGDAS